MKRSRIFTGLAALALSIGLVLAGCESATGDAGSPGAPGDPGGGGLPGPITGPVTSDGLDRLLSASLVKTAYVIGPVTVTKSGTGLVTIPAEKTLSVLGGALTLNGGVILNAVAGTLALDDRATVIGTGSPNTVLLDGENPKVIAGANLIVPELVSTADAITGATGQIALVNPTLTAELVTALKAHANADGKAAYVLGDVTLPGEATEDLSAVYVSFLNTVNTGGLSSLTLGANSKVNGLVAGGALTLAGLGAGNVGTLDVATFTVTSAVTSFALLELNGSTGKLSLTGVVTATDIDGGTGSLEFITGSPNFSGDAAFGNTGATSFGAATTFGGNAAFGGNTTFADDVTLTADKSIFVNRGKSVTFKATTSGDANNVVFSAGASGVAEFALEDGGTFGWAKASNGTFTVSKKKLSLEDANGAITVNGAAKLAVIVSSTGGILDAALGTISVVNGETGSVTLTGATLTTLDDSTINLTAGEVVLDFNTGKPTLSLAHGGSIATTGTGKVIVEAAATNASFGGAGAWAYAATDESTPLVITAESAVLTIIKGNGVLAGSNTATLTAADATGIGITIGQSTTLDLSGGGALAFVSGSAAVVTLAASSSGSDDMTDIGKLALSSTKSIYGGNTGTSGSFTNKFVAGNDTGVDTINNIYVSASTGVAPTLASGVVTLTAAAAGGNVLSSASVIHAY